MEIVKDQKIILGAKNTITAILYVKVLQLANWDNVNMKYSLADGWNALNAGVTAQPTGVYYRIINANTSAADYYILADNNVEIDGDMMNGEVEAADGATLSFAAYICQYDGFADMAAAWAAWTE